MLGSPATEARQERGAHRMDWYETTEPQRVLGYRNRSYHHYAGEMRALLASMMAG